MSRHRNLKQYIDEYDDEDYYDEDDYYEEGEEEYEVKPAVKPKKQSANNPAAAPKPVAPAPAPPATQPTGLLIHHKKKNPNVNQVTMQLDKVSLANTAFSKALAPTTATSSAPTNLQPAISTKLVSSTASAFDFSTPSPDDIVIQARKRQETRTAGIKTNTTIALAAAPLPLATTASAATKPAVKTKAEEKRDEEDDAADAGKKPFLSLVVVGHVDAGKSTLMGHLLADLGFVDNKQMHKFEKESRDMGKSSFKYAWVMDEHAEERERGVTIDVGVKRFETANRRILLLDAPGHRDFVPNMITGASQADAAILVVPSVVGEFESSFSAQGQTREHAWLLKNLGCGQVIIAVNKMDHVDWDEHRFNEIQTQLSQFLIGEVGFAKQDIAFVPVSGLTGENLHFKRNLPEWAMKSRSITECLDLLPCAKRPVDKPLRIVVTDFYKSIHLGLVCTGKLESGVVRKGDLLTVCPLPGITATVKEVIMHGQPVRRAKAGENCEIALMSKEHVLLELFEGEAGGIVLCDSKSPVPVASKLTCRVQTMPSLKYPLHVGSQLIFHAHSTSVPCQVTKIIRAGDKTRAVLVKTNQVAELEIKLEHGVCLERFQDFKPLSRFLLRFAGQTVAAGVVLEM